MTGFGKGCQQQLYGIHNRKEFKSKQKPKPNEAKDLTKYKTKMQLICKDSKEGGALMFVLL